MTVHEMDKGDMWMIDSDIYVVPTNARGIFGAGLAKEFAGMFPAQAEAHYWRCQRGEVGAGDMHADGLGKNQYGAQAWVAFIATTDEPFQLTLEEWLRSGLAALYVLANMSFICPRGRVALPGNGWGLGALKFTHLHKLVLDQFDATPLDVALFPPR